MTSFKVLIIVLTINLCFLCEISIQHQVIESNKFSNGERRARPPMANNSSVDLKLAKTNGQEDERQTRQVLRRFNLFNGLWNRARSSPLYLINGTVCRFINDAPVCTTLATNGILLPSLQLDYCPKTAARSNSATAAALYSTSALQSGYRPQLLASSVEYSIANTESGSQTLRPASNSTQNNGTQQARANVTDNLAASQQSPVRRSPAANSPLVNAENPQTPTLVNVVMSRRPLLTFRRPLFQYGMPGSRVQAI